MLTGSCVQTQRHLAVIAAGTSDNRWHTLCGWQGLPSLQDTGTVNSSFLGVWIGEG